MASCYLKVGSISEKIVPCNHTAISEGKHTSCCEPDDLCLTNGLCRNPTVNEATNYAWRFGCTDATLADPSCGNYCNNITNDFDNQLTWKCSGDETWCCNTGEPGPAKGRYNRTNTTCCSISELLFHAANPTVYTTASLMSLSFSIDTWMASATASSTTISNITVGASASAPPEARRSNSLAIGLGTGLGAVAAIVLGVGFLLFRRRKRRANEPQEEIKEHGCAEVMSNCVVELTATKEPMEMMVAQPPSEMDTSVEPVEMPGGEERERCCRR
ncbi:uncharacterized protein K460DRAFT_180448 [Cucurbitaria berberidis CBS 394.84]|uniref:Uncharacterized protein n=1 Tax=Cucurbitaria berberidis CBS 394.84 TaxID=1168544 RepID=A0A9P4L543_9PLEO|nr:uncharacterized protein K460DRAFT_180448 [Cucurbitaria berberidis CBS 394.84]KAF1842225.1 hypothetical protein K460DRAFT_180448 [Cucurbitaria berberidis CBS 394.84]